MITIYFKGQIGQSKTYRGCKAWLTRRIDKNYLVHHAKLYWNNRYVYITKIGNDAWVIEQTSKHDIHKYIEYELIKWRQC